MLTEFIDGNWAMMCTMHHSLWILPNEKKTTSTEMFWLKPNWAAVNGFLIWVCLKVTVSQWITVNLVSVLYHQ